MDLEAEWAGNYPVEVYFPLESLRCGPGTRDTQEGLEVGEGDITSPSHPTLQVTAALQVTHLQPEPARKKYSA